jgi:D-tagatose-1,6-bisphosphate aldolase subunit GatZ/KbaZ
MANDKLNKSKAHPLRKMIESQKSGIPAGIYSACSANELVIEAVMERAKRDDDHILIEATANQVNQYGGYTGMRPADFRDFVFSIAKKVNFSRDRIILGGDHLGPLTWKNLVSEKAMEESRILIREFVLAGFTKIHLDTSMHLADDDKTGKFKTEIIAGRGADLCETAEKAFKELKSKFPDAIHPVYVVGSEVPIPGGAQEEEGIQVTKPSDFEDTVECFKNAFYRLGLQDAWENVIAVVVQPGVEFGDESIHEYDRTAAKNLTARLSKYPGLVFEGHSTDYQTEKALKEMVEDGIAILKVGPALTFALREGLFALNMIEKELFKDDPSVIQSDFTGALNGAMLKNPENWKHHYHGNDAKIRLALKYSFSDRCRYYLPVKEVKDSLDLMMKNLSSIKIPLTLISQYMPVQYTKIRKGLLKSDPASLAKDRVVNCIDEYLYAARLK